MFGWKRQRVRLLDEFAMHIEDETQANIDRGMSPEQARHEAKKSFGSVGMAEEATRESVGYAGFERLMQDVRYAVRSLRRVPGYAVTLVLTLALGLGCSTAMLAIVESVLVRPVALPHSEQLVDLSLREDVSGTHASPHAIAYKTIGELMRDNRSFTGIGGYNTMIRPVKGADGTRTELITTVTPGLFKTLGVEAKLGRLIGESDAKMPVVVVSEELWRGRLGASPGALGKPILIADKPYTLIGVLPSEMHFPNAFSGSMLYIPASLEGEADVFKLDSASVVARLKPGVTRQQALQDAQALVSRSEAAKPAANTATMAGTGQHLVMRAYREVVVGDLEKPLVGLLGGVGVLLLIACANAANLQIGRAASRLPEMQVRSALGASFGRLLQQLITESVLVALVSSALGVAFSFVVVSVLRHAYGTDYARFDELRVSPLVIVAAALLALAVGVAATIAPALNIRRSTGARANAKNVTRSSRLPGLLVALQVGLTCVLLVTSGLFVRTLGQLENVPLGFDPQGVSTLVLVPENPNQAAEKTRSTSAGLLRRFASLPGVTAVTMQTDIPFSNYNVDMDGTTDVSGRPFQKGDDAHYSFVSTDFVKTSGIRLLAGRGFEASDEDGSALMVLVNEAFVRKYLDGRSALGVTAKMHRTPDDTDATMPITGAMTIVGVVQNEMQGGDLGAAFEPIIYIDYLQLPTSSQFWGIFNLATQFAIRSKLPAHVVAGEVRTALKEEAPDMTEMSLKPMSEAIADSLSQRRLGLRLVAGFGLVALTLSAIGIYGVLAYSVALRRREIGIRMALGSSRRQVARLVLRQAGFMVVLGLVPGIVGAWVAGRAVSSFLYGVSPLDPATLGSVAGILLLVSIAAAGVPTLRAARVDPVETLRAE